MKRCTHYAGRPDIFVMTLSQFDELWSSIGRSTIAMNYKQGIFEKNVIHPGFGFVIYLMELFC